MVGIGECRKLTLIPRLVPVDTACVDAPRNCPSLRSAIQGTVHSTRSTVELRLSMQWEQGLMLGTPHNFCHNTSMPSTSSFGELPPAVAGGATDSLLHSECCRVASVDAVGAGLGVGTPHKM